MHGFVDIESKRFASILDMCGILLNPSISEGCAVSVLNVLGNGALLPICSSATGVDFGDASIRVEEVSYEAFEQALILADAMPVEEFAQKAWDAHRYVHDNCSLEQFEERMFGFISYDTDDADDVELLCVLYSKEYNLSVSSASFASKKSFF